MYLIRQLSHG